VAKATPFQSKNKGVTSAAKAGREEERFYPWG